MVNVFYYIAVPLFLFVCLILIGLILLQKGRGGGLASAFGGAGGNTAFGSKTGDVLTWATSIIFGVFVLLAIGLNLLADAKNAKVYKPTTAPVSQSVPVNSSELPATPPAEAPATQPQ